MAFQQDKKEHSPEENSFLRREEDFFKEALRLINEYFEIPKIEESYLKSRDSRNHKAGSRLTLTDFPTESLYDSIKDVRRRTEQIEFYLKDLANSFDLRECSIKVDGKVISTRYELDPEQKESIGCMFHALEDILDSTYQEMEKKEKIQESISVYLNNYNKARENLNKEAKDTLSIKYKNLKKDFNAFIPRAAKAAAYTIGYVAALATFCFVAYSWQISTPKNLTDAKDKITELKQELSSSRAQEKDKESKLADLKKLNDKLILENRSKDKNNTSLRLEIEELSDKVDIYQKKYEEQLNDTKIVKDKNQELSSLAKTYQKDLTLSEILLQQLREDHKDLIQEKLKLKEKYDETSKRYEDLKEQYIATKDKLDEKDNQSHIQDNLQEKLELSMQNISQLKDSLDSKEEKINDYQDKIKNLHLDYFNALINLQEDNVWFIKDPASLDKKSFTSQLMTLFKRYNKDEEEKDGKDFADHICETYLDAIKTNYRSNISDKDLKEYYDKFGYPIYGNINDTDK